MNIKIGHREFETADTIGGDSCVGCAGEDECVLCSELPCHTIDLATQEISFHIFKETKKDKTK